MTNLAIQTYLSYKGLFMWFTGAGVVINVVVRPALLLLMYALVGRFAGYSRTDDFVIGVIAFSIPWILHAGILQTFYYERTLGTLSVIFGSPGNRLAIYVSRGLPHCHNPIIAVAIGLIVGPLLVDLDLSHLDWLAMSCAVLAMTASCSAFALLLGSFVIAFRDWVYFFAGIIALYLGLTGAIIPTDRLPGFLSEIGWFVPLTNGLVAFRGAFEGGGVTTVGEYLLRELAVGVVYAVTGYLVFRLIEIEAKRRGNLEAI